MPPVASFATWDPTLLLQLPDFGLDALQTAQNTTLSHNGYGDPPIRGRYVIDIDILYLTPSF
jgi:hypothetical protein